ncbi:uncharacterized protein JN550_005765 [Neoarthrinium moseri]|uniref:uncharacterized protein n=1 Tax=Neoarthrinium moseri TaxID=1658444 RepID=UPI001FDC614B|nr:uncharacterized protein JN550_005765 [Neoarthrinium moseri]KAI1869784.1 hypothetical protein JN550_005765 [Neoarthrinium moseri]
MKPLKKPLRRLRAALHSRESKDKDKAVVTNAGKRFTRPEKHAAAVQKLLRQEICSLNDLIEVRDDYAFVAFDAEFLQETDTATEIGVALLPRLKPLSISKQPGQDRLTLDQFADCFDVQSHSMKIKSRYFQRVQQVAELPRGSAREPFWFGIEKYVALGILKKQIYQTIDQYQDSVPDKKLVLIGYDMTRDMEVIMAEFPGLARYFSKWLDVRTLFKSTAENLIPHTTPGVKLTLHLFDYDQTASQRLGLLKRDNSRSIYRWKYDNAGNDAVRTLALIHGLLLPENLDKLRFRMLRPEGIYMVPGESWPDWSRHSHVARISANHIPHADSTSVWTLQLFEIAQAVEKHGAVAVGRFQDENTKPGTNVSFWAAFKDLGSLQRFIQEKDSLCNTMGQTIQITEMPSPQYGHQHLPDSGVSTQPGVGFLPRYMDASENDQACLPSPPMSIPLISPVPLELPRGPTHSPIRFQPARTAKCRSNRARVAKRLVIAAQNDMDGATTVIQVLGLGNNIKTGHLHEAFRDCEGYISAIISGLTKNLRPRGYVTFKDIPSSRAAYLQMRYLTLSFEPNPNIVELTYVNPSKVPPQSKAKVKRKPAISDVSELPSHRANSDLSPSYECNGLLPPIEAESRERAPEHSPDGSLQLAIRTKVNDLRRTIQYPVPQITTQHAENANHPTQYDEDDSLNEVMGEIGAKQHKDKFSLAGKYQRCSSLPAADHQLLIPRSWSAPLRQDSVRIGLSLSFGRISPSVRSRLASTLLDKGACNEDLTEAHNHVRLGSKELDEVD